MKKQFVILMTFLGILALYSPPLLKSQVGEAPSKNIRTLYEMYKTLDTRSAKEVTTGKFLQIVEELEKQVKSRRGKLLNDTKNFGSLIHSYRVVESVENNNYALVSIFWILDSPQQHYKEVNHKKVQNVQYLMKKIDNQWKITNAKLKKEFYLYDRETIDSIYQNIKEGS